MTEYDAGYLVGILFGVLLMGVTVLLFLRFTRKERSMKCKYDERQMLVRGKGFQYAFGTLFAYNLIYAVLGDYMELAVSGSVILFFGIILSVLVYAAYTIWNDGYFPLYEKSKSWIGLFIAIAILNIINGIRNIWNYGVIQNGVISDSILNFMAGSCILLVLAVLFAKRFSEKRKGQDEE